eukprot:1181037-Prorocentrum_minimum.AAC.6
MLHCTTSVWGSSSLHIVQYVFHNVFHATRQPRPTRSQPLSTVKSMSAPTAAVRDALRAAIQRGAPMYNQGDHGEHATPRDPPPKR